ncbi:hypothetical protein DCS_07703 [Drechmeria coniospora]|uniref:Glutamyl-tRNA amidotransferase complex subunit Gta3 domain-containing protein n=1 Tax=Drechmeria coniospora TaxID=98403 RepID=A0A151GF78_DRECN|nr:hypothetical protein DCS_07703 [Drechmeria coniospora]KYK55739.1 hypothetical protein DCS_07703 [Drechmeria coniospora]ODA81661.1 hypothetical protein RJ55_00163 [Drechmeria coniospora]
MSICAHCRLAIRQAFRRPRVVVPRIVSSTQAVAAKLSTTSSSSPSIAAVRSMLSSDPAWSTSDLHGDQPVEPIPRALLHHLLRLAALPRPSSQTHEDAMIAMLQSQLHFVRAVQRIDTTSVAPLSAIRDETDAAIGENTVGLDDLRHALAEEELVGHYKRPRRIRHQVRSDAEKWDALSTASRKAGKYFVVESPTRDA